MYAKLFSQYSIHSENGIPHTCQWAFYPHLAIEHNWGVSPTRPLRGRLWHAHAMPCPCLSSQWPTTSLGAHLALPVGCTPGSSLVIGKSGVYVSLTSLHGSAAPHFPITFLDSYSSPFGTWCDLNTPALRKSTGCWPQSIIIISRSLAINTMDAIIVIIAMWVREGCLFKYHTRLRSWKLHTWHSGHHRDHG